MDDEFLLHPIPNAKRILGCGTTTIYKLIGTGRLDARKRGTSTVITDKSLRAYAESLPPADIRTGQRTRNEPPGVKSLSADVADATETLRSQT